MREQFGSFSQNLIVFSTCQFLCSSPLGKNKINLRFLKKRFSYFATRWKLIGHYQLLVFLKLFWEVSCQVFSAQVFLNYRNVMWRRNTRNFKRLTFEYHFSPNNVKGIWSVRVIYHEKHMGAFFCNLVLCPGFPKS